MNRRKKSERPTTAATGLMSSKGRHKFFWDDWEVSEDEYRRNARPEDVVYLDEALAKKDQ